jgi:5-hydroxyisourate hydrolase
MSKITTHVLDTVLGKPAGGIRVRLERLDKDQWTAVSTGVTDTDGRCRDLAENAAPATYRLTFETGSYLLSAGRSSIYPEISITFRSADEQHYHLPLLLSDNSYTTYRGS